MYNLVGRLMVPALILSLSAVAFMVIALARKGDERRDLILAKAGLHTLIILTVVLVICAVRNLVEKTADLNFDPFVLLTGMALLFAGELFYWKHRYGG